jgi:hypothetical protein
VSATSNPRLTDALDGLVEYRVDLDAEPGNVVPPLAALLIDLARRGCTAECLEAQEERNGNK